MRVLVCVRDEGRQERLIEIVTKVQGSIECINASFACSLATGLPTERVAAGVPYDLIVYHCGGANPELQKFLDWYHLNRRQLNWSNPAWVLFSGDAGSLADWENRVAGDLYVCVVTQSELTKGLAEFVAAMARLPASVIPPFETFGRSSAQDLCFGALNALQRGAWLWEASPGRGLVDVLRQETTAGTGDTDIAALTLRRLAVHAGAPSTSDSWPPARWSGVVSFLDSRVTDFLSAASVQISRVEVARFDQVLETMANSRSPAELYVYLSAFRDCLLADGTARRPRL